MCDPLQTGRTRPLKGTGIFPILAAGISAAFYQKSHVLADIALCYCLEV